jgi:hypothetical protein
MDRELTRLGVVHEFVTVPGAGHGLAGGDKKLVAEAQAKGVEFVRKYLR